MKANIATTKEQSARLLRSGVSADTADMCWYIESGKINKNKLSLNTEFIGSEFSSSKDHIEYIPAWSLSALLGLLPKEIYDEACNGFYFSLAQEFPASDDYNAAYKPCWDDGDELVEKYAPCPIEACVQLIEWLTENNYKLNEI